MGSSDVDQAVHVVYSGHVQGVGFRYTVSRIARGFDITGYVMNRCDGSVQLVAEADIDTLQAFLGEIDASGLDRLVFSRDVNWGVASGQFDGFGIQHEGSGGNE